ncbi:MAG: hypothetical protein KKC50_06250 [Candidatus Omnitrophica bacterium]|nr:hypothetical protein [Candidatus Omnitrophota bacterium]
MKKKTDYDHIDRELSRAYFGHGADQASKDGDNAVGQITEALKKATNTGKKRMLSASGKLKISSCILTTVILGLFLAYFFRDKKVFFTIVGEESNAPSLTRTVRLGLREIKSTAKTAARSSEGTETLFDFEKDTDGWEIPLWAKEKPDHVAVDLSRITGMASSGKGSLEVSANFTGDKWAAAYVETAQYLDFGDHDFIAADIYIPLSCPKGLKAKFIVTAGENWRFMEMTRSVPLIPGGWTTIQADITEESRDWRNPADKADFRSDVRKFGIRVESNPRPAYSGPIYIDNVRVGKALSET